MIFIGSFLFICFPLGNGRSLTEKRQLPLKGDIPKIIKFKATNSLRVSCLFCIFKHSPKKRFDGQNWGNLN